VIGPVVAAAGLALFTVPGADSGSYWTSFFPAAVVLGVGLSAQASAVTTVALNSVEAGRSGLASAINNAFSQTAALLAIAVLGVLMFTIFSGSLDGRLEALDLPSEATRQLEQEKLQLGAAEVPEGLDAASAGAVERAIDEAFVSGYRAVMLVAAGMALASALSAALLIEGKTKTSEAGSATRLGDLLKRLETPRNARSALRVRRLASPRLVRTRGTVGDGRGDPAPLHQAPCRVLLVAEQGPQAIHPNRRT
jgi:hypothetical protein